VRLRTPTPRGDSRDVGVPSGHPNLRGLSDLRTTTLPCASTPWTRKTLFAMSNPIVVLFGLLLFVEVVVSSPLWHITMPLGRGGVHTINLLGLMVAHQRDAGAQGGDPTRFLSDLLSRYQQHDDSSGSSRLQPATSATRSGLGAALMAFDGTPWAICCL
jgi:hypothetical protein